MSTDDQPADVFFKYWGKAQKQADTPDAPYHLLPFHSLDVAAVGYELLAPHRPLVSRLAKQLHVDVTWLQNWFCFCLSLHDLGKFFRAFQNLAPNLSADLVPEFTRCSSHRVRHDTLGFSYWQLVLAKPYSDYFPSKPMSRWLGIVCGHHGVPPDVFRAYKSCLLAEDEQAIAQFVAAMVDFWSPDAQPLNAIDDHTLARCSWSLAGLAVLADWLGSNQAIFNYCAVPMSLGAYWQEQAIPKAARAVVEAGIGDLPVRPFNSIRDQFPFIEQATPLQNYAESVALTSHPQLFILEDVTGAGKTEAAMVLVHRLMAEGLAQGLYVGLPTMATATAMYHRLTAVYQQLYSDEAMPSLTLVHSASQLVNEFKRSVVLSEHDNDHQYETGELSASAYCNAWLADNRKKALLADVGIGTIDQALLSVLPARHQSLRLLGLANKVLLIDEVHAFDAYVRQLLCTLLEAHAQQGGSAILLSATLPQHFRQELARAYAHGARLPEPVLNCAAHYPWATHLGVDVVEPETALTTRPSVKRKVLVQRLSTETQALERIIRAVAEDRCVCWIRNTVADAQQAYAQLQENQTINAARLHLFHSRYAMVDRQRIEMDVMPRFGTDSSAETRCGQVLIATQVVEQSLDLDFDVLITDLAPIDLLIQRAGRLQRHARSRTGNRSEYEQRDPPCLYVLSPDPKTVDDGQWLRALLPGTQAVYPHVGQLWLGIDELQQRGGFAMPDDARALIEGVYGEVAQERIPEPLLRASHEALAEQRATAGIGQFVTLKLDKGYRKDSAAHNGGWDEDVNLSTRLTGDTVSCALVLRKHGCWQAYADEGEQRWPLSQITLPREQWEKIKKHIPPPLQTELSQLKERHSALRWLELLPLVDELAAAYDSKIGWHGLG